MEILIIVIVAVIVLLSGAGVSALAALIAMANLVFPPFSFKFLPYLGWVIRFSYIVTDCQEEVKFRHFEH